MAEASDGEDARCGWLLDAHDEDGPAVRECGATLHFTETGFHCDHGHSHTDAETRHAQGWDYAHDETEASLLGRAGVIGIGMDGNPF
ncbi:hypothetical protein [Streptomyces atratus]|uniref:hypothetical protein n=1 Tax=Streptomyces atratus TaxID=1893 RepID=UPI0033DB673E